MKKIYDCFVFNDEIDLLEIRLHTLNSVVDQFIIIEGERSWQNNKKEPTFKNIKTKFETFLPKIHHYIIQEDKFVSDPWTNERMSFDTILTQLQNIQATDEDIIMVSCCDEIPNPDVVSKLKDMVLTHTHFQQKLYYYFINTIFNHWGSIFWNGTMVIPFKDLLERGAVYDLATQERSKTPLQNGGWHFSYIGGADQIHTKLQSFSHSEYKNTSKEYILQQINQLKDLYNRNNVYFETLDPEENWPLYIQKNKEKFSKLIYNKL